MAVAVVVKLVSSYFPDDTVPAIVVSQHHDEDDHEDEKEQLRSVNDRQQERQGQKTADQDRSKVGGVKNASSIAYLPSSKKTSSKQTRNSQKRPRQGDDTVATTTRETVKVRGALWKNPFSQWHVTSSGENVVSRLACPRETAEARDHAVAPRKRRTTTTQAYEDPQCDMLSVMEITPPPPPPLQQQQQGRRGKRRKLHNVSNQPQATITMDYSGMETNDSILPEATDADVVIVIADAASGSCNTLRSSPDLLSSSLSSSNSVTAAEEPRAVITTTRNHYRANVKNETVDHGHHTSIKVSGKRQAYSSSRTVGSRCYVKHPNRQWYWATLTGVHSGPPVSQQHPRSNARQQRPVINRRTTRFSVCTRLCLLRLCWV